MKKFALLGFESQNVWDVLGSIPNEKLTIDDIRKLSKTIDKIKEANKEYYSVVDKLRSERVKIQREVGKQFRDLIRGMSDEKEIKALEEQSTRNINLQFENQFGKESEAFDNKFKDEEVECVLSDDQYTICKTKFEEYVLQTRMNKKDIVKLLDKIDSAINE